MVQVSVVAPVYNEEESIEKLYHELIPVLVKLKRSFEIVFVDDGSKDRTFEILQRIAKKDSAVKIVKLVKNFGQTPALLAGLRNSKGSVIITMDADLQNDPTDIPGLIAELDNGYGLVCGWRKNRQDSFGKRTVSKFANFIRRLIIPLDIHDSGCTLRAYRRETIEDIDLYGETHRYIPAIIASKGFRVGEIVVSHRERKFGKTKYGLARLPKGFLDLLTIKFLSDYGTRPIHVFGGIGLVSFALGFLGGLWLLYEKFVLGKSIGGRPLLVLVLLLIILGIQFILNGFIAELLIRTRHSESYKIEKIVNR